MQKEETKAGVTAIRPSHPSLLRWWLSTPPCQHWFVLAPSCLPMEPWSGCWGVGVLRDGPGTGQLKKMKKREKVYNRKEKHKEAQKPQETQKKRKMTHVSFGFLVLIILFFSVMFFLLLFIILFLLFFFQGLSFPFRFWFF